MSQAASPAADARDLIELYYAKGWTDGLPVMPPSEDSVGAMLAAGGYTGSEVLGEIPDRHVTVTTDKVAINAVLAGCLPEYMPVVAAAVKGLCDPAYCYHGTATSTGGSAVATLVNGPITEKLEINCKENLLGQGWRANATIGRAIRLIMMNAINTRPGKLDRSTLGNPGKYTLCFAENEAESPWEAFHVERGFAASESTVTVFACEGHIQIYNQLSNTAEQLLLPFADAMGNLGSMNIAGQAQLMVIIAGEHCETLRKNGWSKQQVREYLYEHSARTVAEVKRAGRLAGPEKPGDESAKRHPTQAPEDILIVAAGGQAGSFSAVLTGWGSAAHTRHIITPVTVP